MFYLHNPNSKANTYIQLRIYLSDGRLNYSTGLEVAVKNWNQEAHRVIRDTDKINPVLNRLENSVEQMRKDARIDGSLLTVEKVRNELKKIQNRGKVQKPKVNMFDAIDQIIEERRNGTELKPNQERFSEGSIHQYECFRKNLFKYNPNLTFESITLKTHQDMTNYWNAKNQALNTVGKFMKFLKTFMIAANKRGWNNNLICKDPGFVVAEEETPAIYLTEAELAILYEKHLPVRMWDIARDWIIIASYTALRVSDLLELSLLNFNDGIITVINIKTKAKVAIPTHPYITSILKKWKGFPPKISPQKLNKHIKDVGEYCKINEPVLYSVTKGGIRQDTWYKKYEMIESHTGRRSCLTNMSSANLPNKQMKLISGIKRNSTLERYIKLTTEENANNLKNHAFFTGKK